MAEYCKNKKYIWRELDAAVANHSIIMVQSWLTQLNYKIDTDNFFATYNSQDIYTLTHEECSLDKCLKRAFKYSIYYMK